MIRVVGRPRNWRISSCLRARGPGPQGDLIPSPGHLSEGALRDDHGNLVGGGWRDRPKSAALAPPPFSRTLLCAIRPKASVTMAAGYRGRPPSPDHGSELTAGTTLCAWSAPDCHVDGRAEPGGGHPGGW